LDEQVQELLGIIKREISILEDFLTLLTEEQKHLVKNDVPALEKTVSREEEAVTQAQKLEKLRLKLTDDLAEELNIDKNKVNLSLLISLVEESYSSKLEELQKTLWELFRKVDKQKRKNEFLIKQSMSLLDREMKFFLGEKTSPHYSKPGEKRKNGNLHLVVNQVG
jgi:flagellar biosynthesis/type III secretory pathway chaperone